MAGPNGQGLGALRFHTAARSGVMSIAELARLAQPPAEDVPTPPGLDPGAGPAAAVEATTAPVLASSSKRTTICYGPDPNTVILIIEERIQSDWQDLQSKPVPAQAVHALYWALEALGTVRDWTGGQYAAPELPLPAKAPSSYSRARGPRGQKASPAPRVDPGEPLHALDLAHSG